MRIVGSFSGGQTSAYMCQALIEKFGADNVDFVYMDTGAEHPETYKFIKKVDSLLGLKLTCLRGDFDQPLGEAHGYKVIPVDEIKYDLEVYRALVKKYGTPTVVSPFCTARMKIEVFEKYCNDTYGEGGYQTWIGIRADEPKRLKKMGASPHLKYLAEISDFEKVDVIRFWEGMPFKLMIPEWLGNCVFCFKKSDLKLAAAAHDEQEMLSEWLEMIDGAADRLIDWRESKYVMYRKNRTLPDLIGVFDGVTGQEIKGRMKGAKHFESGSCSESCELYPNGYGSNIDLFPELLQPA